MALFQQSQITVSAAKIVVADSSNSGGDATMLARALKALDQATQKWNNKGPWKFLQTVSDIALVAPFTVTAVSATNASPVLTHGTASAFINAGVALDDIVSYSGFSGEIYVTNATTSATTITLSAAAVTPTSPGVATFNRADYALPSDFVNVISAELLGANIPLFDVNERERTINDPTNTAGQPYGYNLYPAGVAGKIRIVRPNSGADTLRLKYQRRLVLPSSLNVASALDIPADYEFGLLSLAKYFYLTDKGGPPERLQTHKEEGYGTLMEARAKQIWTNAPPRLVPPGLTTPNIYGNSEDY